MTDRPIAALDPEDRVIAETIKLVALLGFPPGRRWPAGVGDQLRVVRQAMADAATEEARAEIDRLTAKLKAVTDRCERVFAQGGPPGPMAVNAIYQAALREPDDAA